MSAELLSNDTICAPATPVGGGAVSIIRISGPKCFEIVDSVVEFLNGSAVGAKGYTLKRGRLAELDDVLVGIFRAPKSYTSEDCAEIYCHASPYIVRSALDLLCSKGCRMAEPGEFTRRAFINGKMDLAQAEAVADLIASSSRAQHRVASSQLRGGYSQELRLIRASLVELSALLELELDFSEEEVEFANRERLAALLEDALKRCETLASSFRLGNAIKNGIPVAIAGAPNSGKSTLLNALLCDDRAIVSDIPGTTRDTIEEARIIGGALLRFIDTAGLRESSDTIERMGIERSREAIRKAFFVLAVIDISSPHAAENCLDLLRLCREAGERAILVLNKVDLGETASEGKEMIVDVRAASPAISSPDISSPAISSPSISSPDISSPNISSPAFSSPDISTPEIEDSSMVFGLHEIVNKNVSLINKIVSSTDYKDVIIGIAKISAKTGFGLEELKEMIVSACDSDSETDVLVTSQRHADALLASAHALRACLAGLRSSLSADLLAEDLREALRHLGSITGEITSDEVLGEIFKGFCIGK